MRNFNSNIPHKVVRMEDLYQQKTVEHNDLITSVAKMDKIPLKFFELAVSCLDTENSPEDNTVHLSKKTLFSFFKATDKDRHARFKNALTTLHQQSIFEVRDENKKGKWNFKIISPISSSEWNDYNDTVAIKFTDDIMPYLIDLKRSFTQYLITFDFEKNVLKSSLEEINEYTHFVITYSKIKKGRSIAGVQFHIEKKKNKSPLPYKENDPEYQKDKAQQEQERQNLFNKAVQSKYTTLLGENFLIGFRDMQDVSRMADLQKQVYPLYDELKDLRGLNGVKDHISYVAAHKDGASIQLRNVVKYLKRSIEQYLQTVKIQDLDG